MTTITTNDKGQTTRSVMDAQGLLAQVIDNDGNITEYTYDAFGNLIEIEDASGNITTMEYDIRGRKTSMDDPDMGKWSYVYNGFSELIKQTDAKGQVVEMEYDKLGRMTRRTVPGGGGPNCFFSAASFAKESTETLIWKWYYDSVAHGKGKLAKVTGPEGYQEEYAYDTKSRLHEVTTTIEGNTYVVKTDYDETYGRLDKVTYPADRLVVKYSYTNWGYLEKVENAVSHKVYWEADELNALGQITQESLGNDLTTERNYDVITGRLIGISTYKGGDYVQALTYEYDNLGNLLNRGDTAKGLIEDFTYDGLNRLKEVRLNSTLTKTYDYNAIGNITYKSDMGSYTYGFGAAGPHAVTKIGSVKYTYDKNGNMINDSSGRTFEYDAFNKPVTITKGDASASFVYDASHNLIKQTLSQGATDTTTIYIGDLYEKVTTGSQTEYKHYIKAGKKVIAIYTKRSNGTENTYYLHKDHLGSIDVITNESGQVADMTEDALSYDAFGKRRLPDSWEDTEVLLTCQITKHGFTGHLHLDDLGLIYMKARVYDPYLGRFISPDPIGESYVNPQGLNRYSYCNNNPLRYIDPTGYDSYGGFGDPGSGDYSDYAGPSGMNWDNDSHGSSSNSWGDGGSYSPGIDFSGYRDAYCDLSHYYTDTTLSISSDGLYTSTTLDASCSLSNVGGIGDPLGPINTTLNIQTETCYDLTPRPWDLDPGTYYVSRAIDNPMFFNKQWGPVHHEFILDVHKDKSYETYGITAPGLFNTPAEFRHTTESYKGPSWDNNYWTHDATVYSAPDVDQAKLIESMKDYESGDKSWDYNILTHNCQDWTEEEIENAGGEYPGKPVYKQY
ncbi:MAG: RHS repeat protein [Deltaproteobacteria bacterium]|nr:RHS repeat protein [Deltaproteobacteria bacterium]